MSVKLILSGSVVNFFGANNANVENFKKSSYPKKSGFGSPGLVSGCERKCAPVLKPIPSGYRRSALSSAFLYYAFVDARTR